MEGARKLTYLPPVLSGTLHNEGVITIPPCIHACVCGKQRFAVNLIKLGIIHSLILRVQTIHPVNFLMPFDIWRLFLDLFHITKNS